MKGMKSSTALKDATSAGPGFFTASDEGVRSSQAEEFLGIGVSGLGFSSRFREQFADLSDVHATPESPKRPKPQKLAKLDHEHYHIRVIDLGSYSPSRVSPW